MQLHRDRRAMGSPRSNILRGARTPHDAARRTPPGGAPGEAGWTASLGMLRAALRSLPAGFSGRSRHCPDRVWTSGL